MHWSFHWNIEKENNFFKKLLIVELNEIWTHLHNHRIFPLWMGFDYESKMYYRFIIIYQNMGVVCFFFQNRQQCLNVAVCLRSLRVRTAEKKNIPRPSRELMSCKKNTINFIFFIFHISLNFQVTDPYHIRITLVNWSGLIRNRHGTNGYSQSFSF